MADVISAADPKDRAALFENMGSAIVLHVEGLGLAAIPGVLPGPGTVAGAITGIDGVALGGLMKASVESVAPTDRLAIFQQLGGAIVAGIMSALVAVPGVTPGPGLVPGTITGLDGPALGDLIQASIESVDPKDRDALYQQFGVAIALHVMSLGVVVVAGVTPGGGAATGTIT